MYNLKMDRYVKDSSDKTNPILMSDWIAGTLQELGKILPFADYFGEDVLLVPVPKSSLMKRDTLWVPERISKALARKGLGKSSSCLKRVKPVRKSAYSIPAERPKPMEHYDSMEVQGNFEPSREIVLIDDIVTRGSTICGAANRLIEAFPDSRIRAFAAMRTIRSPVEFTGFSSPIIGTIRFREKQGDTTIEP